MVLLGTFLLMSVAAFLIFELQPEFYELNLSRMNSVWGLALIVFTTSLFVFKAVFFFYNLYLYIRYRSIKSVSDDLLPTTTVIVPAYNEGRLVYDTLISLAESDYPAEKLQIISIDDGSKDDTWHWMMEAKTVLGERLSLFKQPENKGKRHALYFS